MLIHRHLFETLKEECARKKITAYVGSRQTGKTTILKRIVELERNTNYITFDHVATLQEFETNIDRFIERFVKPYDILCIDEFQYARDGGKQLKYIFDTQKTKIFISGSSQPEIAIHALQYLVGRVHIIEVFPLSFEEFATFKNASFAPLLKSGGDLSELRNSFEEYLTYGGYPEVVLSNNKEETLKDLVTTYLHKEIRDILAYKNIQEYEMILRRLALSDGGLLNKSNLSQDLGINRNKLAEMLSVLERTYITTTLPPYLNNQIKMLTKSQKMYFHDLGMKNSLLRNFNELQLRQDKGTIYENFVVNALLRMGKKPFFWNVQSRHEVDIVLEEKGDIIGMEVKSRLNKAEITPSMKMFIKTYKPSYLLVLNENLEEKMKEDKSRVRFMPHAGIVPFMKNMKK